ncbi:hypothetical protein R5W24_003043 [Gemmata sp. JC717]|uniref:hypothetical protein n=1 Tax=Gemmata algarum TaxID=2975278 RepID=UPI0021BB6736|nr:hypothetical protein [Gemmata algarum]MDY3553929.1 hypothetical protein [Gemmata algarum]
MEPLNGSWYYQSFVALPADVVRKVPPEIKRLPLIAAPWTPRAIMELTTDGGKITGAAKLGTIEFKITGTVTSAAGPFPDGVQLPAGVELKITVENPAATYVLRGYALEGSDHIVGTVVTLGNDLGFQPAGASGPFVLYPVRPE